MGIHAWQWLIYWDNRAAEEGLGIFPWPWRLPQIWLQLTSLALAPSKRHPSTHTPHWPATAYGSLLESPSQPTHLTSHGSPNTLRGAPAPLYPVSVGKSQHKSDLFYNVLLLLGIQHSLLPFTRISFYAPCLFSLIQLEVSWEENWVFNGNISVNKSLGKKVLFKTKLVGYREGWGEGQPPPYWTGPFGRKRGRRDHAASVQEPSCWGSEGLTNLAPSHAVWDNPKVMCVTGFLRNHHFQESGHNLVISCKEW